LAAEHVPSPQAALEAELAGRIDFLKDGPSLELASSDMFFRSEFEPYALVRPASSETVVALALAAARLDVSLRPRGADLSYTGGYLPRAHGDTVVDCSALNRVISVDPHNLVAVVEAGCTWKTLMDALRLHRLESVIAPPVSGSHSTIGGAISQGLLAGSDSILSITVALPSGTTVTTGSRGYSPNSIAFSQLTGPNLTGLFIGDCGRFGIKTEIALRLKQRASHVAHLGFAFASFRQMVDVAAAIGRSALARSCIGLDRARVETAKSLSFGETLAHAGNLIRSSGPVDTFRVAIGALLPMAEGWPLYVTMEAESGDALKDKLTSLKQFAKKSIHRIDTAIRRALYAEPFSIRGAAGPKGEAWVPIHGLFPHSSAGFAADELMDFLNSAKINSCATRSRPA